MRGGRALWALAAVAVGGSFAACGGANSNVAKVGYTPEPAASLTVIPLPRRPEPKAHVLALVGDKALGPLLARRAGTPGALMAYSSLGAGGGRYLYTVAVQPSGEAASNPRHVVALPNDATALHVSATGSATGGERPGFVATWVSLADRGMAINVAGIADDGSLRNAPTEIARTADNIVWADILPTPRGAVCVWAEETRAGDANVLVVALDPDGKPRGVPSRVARGARAWQVVDAGGTPGLALVVDGAEGRAGGGALLWQKLDVDGRPRGAPITVVARGVGLDLDAVRGPKGTLFAWTERGGAEPEVTAAYLDDDGTVARARALVPEAGGSTLAGIAVGRAGAVVAWEEPHKRSREERPLHLARVDPGPGLATHESAVVDVLARAPRDLVGLDDGFALLASTHPCDTKAGAACSVDDVRPTFVRFDRNLVARQVEPIPAGPAAAADAALAWGLACEGTSCLALTADDGSPTSVRAIDLPVRTTGYNLFTGVAPSADAPRIGAVTTVAGGAAFADVAAAKVGDATLVALVTAAVDARDAHAAPARGASVRGSKRDAAREASREAARESLRENVRGATLSVHALDARGRPAGAAVVLSTRALSVGGVAIAAAGEGGADDGAAVAWVARENGDPQVHVTRVDHHGRRTNDIVLTSAIGDASDVALAWATGGWVVAWVDGRDGNGEVYATKISPDLKRVAREERITRAQGDATGVALLARPDAVWIAWSDTRENPAEGFADIHVATVSPSGAHRVGNDVRVLATAAHSRSPCLAASGAGEGVAVGWIEDAPAGVDAAGTSGYGAMVAWLDKNGRPIWSPTRITGAGDGAPSAVALDEGRPGGGLRVLVARAARDAVVLDAADLAGDGRTPPTFFPIFTLDGPPSLDVALVLHGDAVYFNDDGPIQADRRARRVGITWRN